MKKSQLFDLRKLLLTCVVFFSLAPAFSQTYYWVGGQGDWHDFANHWATASGGATFHVQAPQSFNDVVFDVNSGFLINEKVTHTNVASAVCQDMTWTTGIAGVGMSSNSLKVLDVYGSLTLETGMNFYPYAGTLRFLSSGVETITWNGNLLNFQRISFEPLDGDFTVTDYLDMNSGTTGSGVISINTNNGSVTFNDTVRCGTQYDGIVMRSGTSDFNKLVWGYPNSSPSAIFDKITLGRFYVNGGVANLHEESWIRSIVLNAGTLNAVNSTHYWGQLGHYNINVGYGLQNGTLNISNSTIWSESYWWLVGGSETFFSANSTLNLYGHYYTHSNHTYNNVNAKVALTKYQPGGAVIDSMIFEAGVDNFNGVGGRDNFVSLLRWNPGNYGVPISAYNPRVHILGTCNVEILGNCVDWVVNSGVNFEFDAVAGGSLTSDYMRLENSTASGPGTPYSAGSNSYIVANSPGWSTGTPVARILTWQGPIVGVADVANYGDWHDMNSWSIAGGLPGSPVGANCPPTIYDSVIFPNNSYVRMREAHGNCKGMNWLGTGNFYDSIPTNQLRVLEVYGSLNFSAAMTNNFTGRWEFRAWETYPTITSNGTSFAYHVYFRASSNSGTWHLVDSLAIPNHQFRIERGTFHTDGNPMEFKSYNSLSTAFKRQYFYNSDIWVTGSGVHWNTVNSPSIEQYPGTSHIHFTNLSTNNIMQYGNNLDWYDITFSSPFEYMRRTTSSYGTSTFHDVIFEDGGWWQSYYSSGGTDSIHKLETGALNDSSNYFVLGTKSQFFIDTALYRTNTFLRTLATYNGLMKLYPARWYDLAVNPSANVSTLQTLSAAGVLDAQGNCIEPIIISNGAFFSAGNQSADYLILTDNTASTATFNYSNSSLSGITTGWTGTPTIPRTLYWIDQIAGASSGQWNNMLNWSLTDGVMSPIGGNCPPTPIDTVLFTDNSFTGNDSVIINLVTIPATCADMRWLNTGVVNPVLLGGAVERLEVYASLIFSTTMIQDFLGYVTFKTTSMGQTITSNGIEFNDRVYFNGTGEWTLLDDFTQNGGALTGGTGSYRHKLQLLSGILNTNGKLITTKNFITRGSLPRTLNLDTTEIRVTNGNTIISGWSNHACFKISGTNLTLDADSSHIWFYGYGYGNYPRIDDNTNQNNAWGDLTFRQGTGAILSGSVIADGCSFKKIDCSAGIYFGTVSHKNMNVEHLIANNPSSLARIYADSTIFDTVTFAGPARFYNNNYFTTEVNFSSAKTYTFEIGKTQWLDNQCDLNAIGTAGNEIQFYSSVTGTPSYIRKDSALICIDYIYLRDIHAIGDGIIQSGSCALAYPERCDTIISDTYIPTQQTSGRAEFNGGDNANDQGNNKGWIFDSYPGLPSIHLSSLNDSICQGDSVLLTFELIGPTPINATYFDSIPGIGLIQNDSLGLTSSNFVSGTGVVGDPFIWQFYVHPTVDGEVYSAGYSTVQRCFNSFGMGTGSDTITVNPSPQSVSIVASPAAPCYGDTVSINASSINGVVYNVFDQIGGTLLGTTTFEISPITSDTTLYIEAVTSEGCVNASMDSIQLIIPFNAPTAICQDTTIYLDAIGNVTIDSSFINNGSFDDCSVATIVLDSSSFDCASIGTNTVMMIVTDDIGLADTCYATVTVLDTISPVISCPGDQSASLDGNCQFTLLDYTLSGSAVDNCSTTLTQSPVAGTIVTSNTVVTLFGTDPSGNSDSCSFNVLVSDNTPPTVICQNITAYLDGTGNIVITPSSIDNGSTDNCVISSVTLSQAVFTCADIGVNNVVLYVTDGAGNIDSCTAVVTIADTINPIVICPADQTVNVDVNCQYTLLDYLPLGSATDNCSAVMSQYPIAGTVLTGNSTVTIYGTDPSGNIDSCSFEVFVVDITPPVASCQNITVSLDENGTAVITSNAIDNGSTDNCSIASIALSQSSFNCADIGSNSVTIYVTDGAGNIDSCTAIVSIIDTIPPEVTCPVAQYEEVDGNCVYIVDDYTALSSGMDICDGAAVTITQFPVAGSTVSVDEDAQIIVTIYVEDASGNIDSCDFVVDLHCNDQLIIPEFISPNGDGKNEVLEILGLENFPDNSLQIFNRWGSLIFFMDNYDNSWGGTSNKSTIGTGVLPTGTYFYVLKLNNDNVDDKSGFIELKH